jgi:hypothetical protein
MTSRRPQQPSGILVSLARGAPRRNPTGDPAFPWIGGRAPRQPASRAARATSHAVVQRGPHLDSNAPIDSGSALRELVLSSRSDAASAYHHFLAGAATAALSSRDAARTGDCGRRWSQSSQDRPLTWSQFGRSPAPRQRSATRS